MCQGINTGSTCGNDIAQFINFAKLFHIPIRFRDDIRVFNLAVSLHLIFFNAALISEDGSWNLQTDDINILATSSTVVQVLRAVDEAIPPAQRKQTYIGRTVNTLGLRIRLSPLNVVSTAPDVNRILNSVCIHYDSDVPFSKMCKNVKGKVHYYAEVSSSATEFERSCAALRQVLKHVYGYKPQVLNTQSVIWISVRFPNFVGHSEYFQFSKIPQIQSSCSSPTKAQKTGR